MSHKQTQLSSFPSSEKSLRQRKVMRPKQAGHTSKEASVVGWTQYVFCSHNMRAETTDHFLPLKRARCHMHGVHVGSGKGHEIIYSSVPSRNYTVSNVIKEAKGSGVITGPLT